MIKKNQEICVCCQTNQVKQNMRGKPAKYCKNCSNYMLKFRSGYLIRIRDLKKRIR